MREIPLDFNAPLGGILYQDTEKEIVQLKLQPQNDLPIYQDQRTLLLIALSGCVEIHTNHTINTLTSEKMILLEPNEAHKIKPLTENSHILVIKQKNYYEQY